MEHDHSSIAFDSITCRSGQFGFFQKRIFIINTLIQSACLSILLYTTACMPGVEENPASSSSSSSSGSSSDQDGRVMGIPTTSSRPVHNQTHVTTTVMDRAPWQNSTAVSSVSSLNTSAWIEDSSGGFVNITDAIASVPSSTETFFTTPSTVRFPHQTPTETTWLIEPIANSTFYSNFSIAYDNATTTTDTPYYSYNTISSSASQEEHPFLSLLLPKTNYLAAFSADDLVKLLWLLQGGGAIVGALVGGMMADVYGRRRPLYLAMAGMAVSQCSVGLAGSWSTFLAARTLAVGFAGASAVISFLMIIEFVGPGWRDICACSSLWTFGAVSLAVQSVVTSHWRWMAFSTGGLAIPMLASYLFTEAEGLYRELISVNSAAVPEIMALLDQARACIVNNMHQKRFTFLDLFYNLKSTRWTLALIYTGMVSSCVYTCLVERVRHVTGTAYLDRCLPFVIDLPLTWSVIVVNRCLGRRWCLFLYAIASGFALLSVLVLHVTGNMTYMPSLITGLALFGKIGVTASIAIIFLTAIEMYPTVTRGMGVGVALASASGGALLSFVMLFLEDRHYTVPFIVYGGLMASVGLVGLLLPETLNQPLANVQQCRHRKIPLMEGSRLVGSPPSLWDTV